MPSSPQDLPPLVGGHTLHGMHTLRDVSQLSVGDMVAWLNALGRVQPRVSGCTRHEHALVHMSHRLDLEAAGTRGLWFAHPPFHTKPDGIWYGMGGSWLQYCRHEMPDWIDNNGHVYLLAVDTSDVTMVTDAATAGVLTTDCRDPAEPDHIDWDKVSWETAGVQVDPFWPAIGYTRGHLWYSDWSTESGVVWDPDCVKRITLVATWDPFDEIYSLVPNLDSSLRTMSHVLPSDYEPAPPTPPARSESSTRGASPHSPMDVC